MSGSAGPDPATDELLARDVDDVNFGRDRVETNTFPGPDPARIARERAGRVDAYILHLAEGVPDPRPPAGRSLLLARRVREAAGRASAQRRDRDHSWHGARTG